jgi:hypothetical protein
MALSPYHTAAALHDFKSYAHSRQGSTQATRKTPPLVTDELRWHKVVFDVPVDPPCLGAVPPTGLTIPTQSR